MWGMIILYVGTLMPLAVFLYAGFFRGLPRDYEEAAAIDGAGPAGFLPDRPAAAWPRRPAPWRS